MSASTNDELQMTFWEHLEELRGRILKALVAFAVGGLTAWYFREAVLGKSRSAPMEVKARR